ncbi:MAG: phosphatidate cytidylyltransferase [Actinomycetota bacterium]
MTPTTSVRAQVLLGLVVAVASAVTLVISEVAFAVVVAALAALAYNDFRRLLGEIAHVTTAVIGGLGVVALVWCGYVGDLELIPAVVAGMTLLLLVMRIALNEAGRGGVEGVTGDLSTTIGAAATIGVLAAHVVLIRAVDIVGFRGALAFVIMVVGCEFAAMVVGRTRGRRPLNKAIAPHRTWEGVGAGLVVSVLIGVVVGLAMDPPFDLRSGVAFGLAVGVLAPIGDLAFAVVKRSAGSRQAPHHPAAAGAVIEIVDGALFVAPAFYWAFRTIAL